MKNFAEEIRKLRKEKGCPLRIVAAYLDMDQAILSKIEHGKRKASREQVIKLAEYYEVNSSDLIIEWLSDKLVYEVEDEEMALKVLKAAEEKVIYKKREQFDIEEVIQRMKDFFRKDGRVAKAWIFGSFARGDYDTTSDIDLMVRFKDANRISLFDYADIAYLLEKKINIKVDLVEEGYLQPFAAETATNDLKLIYE